MYTIDEIQVFKLLSDKTRLNIIKLLMEKEGMCVNDISKTIGMTHSATSHQLATLEKFGLVKCERDGKNMCYELQDSKLVSIIRRIIEMFV